LCTPLWFVVKKLVLALCVIVLTVLAGLSSHEEPGQQIDEWAKQTAILFQDSFQFFTSLKPDTPSTQETLDEIEEIDKAIESLLPNQRLNLNYDSHLEPSIDVASQHPDISPEALLPNLFEPIEKKGASVKGEIMRDEEDKIIGGKVQLAIPTEM